MINKWLTRLNFKTIEIENYLNGVETDWDDIVYQTGLQQDYTVSLSNRKEISVIIGQWDMLIEKV